MRVALMLCIVFFNLQSIASITVTYVMYSMYAVGKLDSADELAAAGLGNMVIFFKWLHKRRVVVWLCRGY
jgi:hypothetical protein